jgi:hypothetical protein
MKAENFSISRPSTWNLGRLFGGVGAMLSILCPKCPICWMILTGSAMSGGAAALGVEVAGILLFFIGFYTLLRSRRATSGLVLLLCAASTSIVIAGVWIAHSVPIRMLTCAIVAAVSLMPARWMPGRQAAHDSIPCFSSCQRSASNSAPVARQSLP